MNTSAPWLSAEIQALIESPLIPLIKVELEEKKATNITKVNIWRNPSQDALETYKVNISNFDDGKPE